MESTPYKIEQPQINLNEIYKEQGYIILRDEDGLKNFSIPPGAEIENYLTGMLVYDPKKVEFHEEDNLDEKIGANDIDAKLQKQGWESVGREEHPHNETTDIYIRSIKQIAV